MAAKREIKQILVKVRGKDGTPYAVALCADDTYAILRAGEMLPTTWNTEADLEDCINVMMQHAGLSKTEIKPLNSQSTNKPN